MFLCECETCLEGLGKRGRNKAADTARRGCFELRSGGVEEKCGLRLHATVLSKSSVLQFHSVAMDEGDPQSRHNWDRCSSRCSSADPSGPGLGVSRMNFCLLWRANWDVLIKRGKRGLLTFYDVKEG